ncbi:MAG TPA: hypothetical protein PK002_08605 [Cellvibrio sp.]|nr:hypothetical protein [Cellvibrio sp.]
MNQIQIKNLIEEHAETIRKLHARVHETFISREKSSDKRNEWQRACEEFHKRYPQLAFIGGYDGALERILAGDPHTIEVAFCFLECRPYFFRSGYMYKDIYRKLKCAPLNDVQSKRLTTIVSLYTAWRATKNKRHA